MGVKSARKPSMFIRYMKVPIRVLARARDLYVQSLTGGNGHVSYGNAMGCPTPQIPAIPRSFSTNSTRYATPEDELRDLIRLASRAKIDQVELRRSKSAEAAPYGGGGGMTVVAPVARSRTTVEFGRIDEDKPLALREDDNVELLGGGVFPRSRSYGVPGRIKVG